MPSTDCSPKDSTKNEPVAPERPVTLRGIGVSDGIAIGPLLPVGRRERQVVEKELLPEEIEPEIVRFRQAVDATRRELQRVRDHTAQALGEKEARIFDAHLMIVGDDFLIEEVIARISARRRNAEIVFLEAVGRYMDAFKNVEDAYLRERQTDLHDVVDRVVDNLLGISDVDLSSLPGPCILAAHDFSASQTAGMDRHNVLAFATCLGSRTSHTTIMARAFEIPAVVGIPGLMDQLRAGDTVIVDGTRGLVILRPEPATLRRYEALIEERKEWFRKVEQELSLPAQTRDGFRVQLAANVELPEEIDAVRSTYGVGVGLFRTEYLFINRATLPSEEDQFEAYRKTAEEVFPQSVIIRSLDIGGDKFFSDIAVPQELNPFLGMRAVRFCLSQPEVFRCQLRAILRASAFGKVRVMFPMIATQEELAQTLALLKQAMQELDERGEPYNSHLDIGIMIEVPSAALIAHRLAPYVDFFSIGTNDLVQYALAADRSNPDTAYLYQPGHPSILRLIREVLEAAWAHGKWVSMCGEMAGDPLLTPLVLGLGIHELSMSPVALGPIKTLVRRLNMYEVEALAAEALRQGTAREVTELCRDLLRRTAPELLVAENSAPAGATCTENRCA